MAYLLKTEVNKIEIELTTGCNAACPSCSRTDIDGKAIRSLPTAEISLEDFRRILPASWVVGKTIKLCGVYGDPLVARDFLPIVKYLVDEGAQVVVNTNASMRTPSFWHEFGRTLAESSGSECIFSIDGLEDTNAIYRRNTSWSKIISHAKAFIEAGGFAHWDFLVFSHNDHQVEKAQNFAKELGFKKFTIKKTTRASEEKKPTAIEEALNIKPSNKSEYLNSQLRALVGKSESRHRIELGESKQTKGLLGMLFHRNRTEEKCSIACFTRGESLSQVNKERSFYISAQKKLWPCCWWAGSEFPRTRDIRELYKTYGEGFNSLENSSMDELLEHQWFKKQLVKSWQSEKIIPTVCSRNCTKAKPLNNEDCEDVVF